MAGTVSYRPSNGTEGECFMERWCARCARDADFQDDPENSTGCSILTDTLALDMDDPDYPAEWIEDDVSLPQPSNPRCTAFVPLPDSGVGPIEDDRQGTLL